MSLYSGSYSVHTINENLSVNCKSVHLSNPKQSYFRQLFVNPMKKIIILFFCSFTLIQCFV